MTIAWAGETLFLNSPICVSTNNSAEAAPARRAARFHEGGWAMRSARVGRAELLLAAFFCSSAVALRPVRPRASIVPAAFPRCLERRLRLVWATVRSLGGPRGSGGSGAAPRRRRWSRPARGRPAPHRPPDAGRGPGRADPDKPRAGDPRVARDGGHHHPRRRARRVLDVGGDL